MAAPRTRLRSTWTTVGGWRVHARVSSETPPAGRLPVVLVHGLLVSSRYMVPTAERLAPRFPVYAPDLPGYGLSDKPRGALDVPGLAAALAAWLRAVGLGPAAVVGNSFGCQIAAELAVQQPELVACVVLLGPTVDPRQHQPLRVATAWLRNLRHEPLSLGLVVARDLLDMGVPRTVQTFRYMLADHIERKLPRLRQPTLVVRGELDPTVPQDWAEAATRLLPDGRLRVIPGAAHTINYNAPDAVVSLVEAFAAEIEQRAGLPTA